MAQRPAVLCQVGAASGLADGRGIKQADDEAMQMPAGIEDALKIVDGLPAVSLHRVIHQNLGVAHDGDRGRAQFLPHIGNERPFHSPIGALVG